MSQGVIRCLKAHYRKLLVKLILHSLDSNEPLPKVSLLTALILLLSAWNNVSQTKFVKCFKKAKISEKDQTIAINDEDDPLKEIIENRKRELREKEPSLVPENMAAEDFATVDDAVITTTPSTFSDEKNLQEATQTEKNEVKEIEDDDEELVAPSTRDVENSLEILKNLSLFNDKTR